ncbi:hypothetical protein V5N11_035421 [Cardamine amara subsp. amara]|uniref:Retrotransposon Copia-like N-terminal domain-containing protein n=1 Tax=Cardamine amara subsp. amara TaxID=228776 RepID=A0ABD0ZEG6_CARAN
MTNTSPTVTNSNELRRTISPYNLTSADNPGAVISHPLLKGANYDEWACGLRTALTSRKKFGFLDGSIEKPEADSPDYEDWLTIQHLKKRFSVTSGSRLQQLKSELAYCKQRGLAIKAYFEKLNRIWDNLVTQRPLRTCECGKCVCNLGATQEAGREEDKVHQFLSGLDEQYQSV